MESGVATSIMNRAPQLIENKRGNAARVWREAGISARPTSVFEAIESVLWEVFWLFESIGDHEVIPLPGAGLSLDGCSGSAIYYNA
jgi:hypothetical protein